MARNRVRQGVTCDETGFARAETPAEEAARWARFEALVAQMGGGSEGAAERPSAARAPAPHVDMRAAIRSSFSADFGGSPQADRKVAQKAAPPPSRALAVPTRGPATQDLTEPPDAEPRPAAASPAQTARLPRSLRDAAAPHEQSAKRRGWLRWRNRAEGAALGGVVTALCLALLAPGAVGPAAPDTTAPGLTAAPQATPERAAPSSAAASWQDYAALERLVAAVLAESAVEVATAEHASPMPLSLDLDGAPRGAPFGPVDPWRSSSDLRTALTLGLVRVSTPMGASGGG